MMSLMNAQSTLQATAHDMLNEPSSERGSRNSRLRDLQAFQARIAQKITDAQASTQQSQSLLAVQIGAYSVHIPISDTTHLLALPEISPVPLAKQWLKGLTVVRAEVLTVLDLAYCLNAHMQEHAANVALIASKPDSIQNPTNAVMQAAQAKLLVLNPSIKNQLAVAVDKVFGIVTKGTLTIDSNNHLADGVVIKQMTVDANGVVFIELSLDELFKSDSFLKLTY
jgi:chemotaxis signal transduction protein